MSIVVCERANMKYKLPLTRTAPPHQKGNYVITRGQRVGRLLTIRSVVQSPACRSVLGQDTERWTLNRPALLPCVWMCVMLYAVWILCESEWCMWPTV